MANDLHPWKSGQSKFRPPRVIEDFGLLRGRGPAPISARWSVCTACSSPSAPAAAAQIKANAIPGVRFDPLLDRLSWQATTAFLAAAFEST
jgi:hypothetical protein